MSGSLAETPLLIGLSEDTLGRPSVPLACRPAGEFRRYPREGEFSHGLQELCTVLHSAFAQNAVRDAITGGTSLETIRQVEAGPSDTFRPFQTAVVPGIEGLHRSVRSIIDNCLVDGAAILVVGAGGGRELQTLGASSRNYELVGVDPSIDMLDIARAYVDAGGLSHRTTLVEGLVENLPEGLSFDAATALFVMHFLPDDGAKADFLRSIRKRLKIGAPYLHVDVCFDDRETFERLEPVYAAHAVLGGLTPEAAANAAAQVGTMPIIPEATIRDRLAQNGFRPVTPFFRGLWYAGWWSEAI